MKKLEDIPKKNVFEVPEGYFDRLPGIIHARTAEVKIESQWMPHLRYSLKYALPALVIALAAFFYLMEPAVQSAEELLASVDTANLIAYLEESDISSDDLLDNIPLNRDEASAIHQNSIQEINVGEADVEYLLDKFGIDSF